MTNESFKNKYEKKEEVPSFENIKKTPVEKIQELIKNPLQSLRNLTDQLESNSKEVDPTYGQQALEVLAEIDKERNEAIYTYETELQNILSEGVPQDQTSIDLESSARDKDVALDLENLSEIEFREKYQNSKHAISMSMSENYAARFPKGDHGYGTIDYQKTDIRSQNYVGNPNLSFAAPNMEGRARAEAEQYHMEWIQSFLPVPGLEKLKGVRIPSMEGMIETVSKKVPQLKNFSEKLRDSNPKDLIKKNTEINLVKREVLRGLHEGGDNQVEITKEFVDLIIGNENKRYKSNEAIARAQRIDLNFPPTYIEKLFNNYKLQEKNIDYIGHDPEIFIGDWLEAGEGGHYQKQPPLVSRKSDFIQVTSKANPDEFKQILQHEYNHMFTQGNSNFSSSYKKYLRNMFLDNTALKELSQMEDFKILSQEPFPGAGPVYEYLMETGEINAYLGTNLRHDLLRNGVIENFYDPVDENMLKLLPDLEGSNCNKKETPIYKLYMSMVKDKKALVDWLNNYAI